MVVKCAFEEVADDGVGLVLVLTGCRSDTQQGGINGLIQDIIADQNSNT